MAEVHQNHESRQTPAAAAEPMTMRQPMARLLLLGVGPRMAASAMIVAALWIGFFWATGS